MNKRLKMKPTVHREGDFSWLRVARMTTILLLAALGVYAFIYNFNNPELTQMEVLRHLIGM